MSEVTIKYEPEYQYQRKKRGNPNWVKGKVVNPNGRPVGSRQPVTMSELTQACREVEARKKKPLLEHYVERAYLSDPVLCHLMNKFLPAKITVETPESQKLFDLIAQRFKQMNVIDVGKVR